MSQVNYLTTVRVSVPFRLHTARCIVVHNYGVAIAKVKGHKSDNLNTMGRKKVKEDDVLKHEIKTRVNSRKFRELEKLLDGTVNRDMSSLVRHILHNRPIKVFTYDRSLDITMEELSALRAEVRAIGVNINQITRYFNSYSETRRKEFYAKIAFQQYQAMEPKIDRILIIITQLSKKWLSE